MISDFNLMPETHNGIEGIPKEDWNTGMQ